MTLHSVRPFTLGLFLALLATGLAGAVPEELQAALNAFRPDPAKGWSYTQRTEGDGRSTEEHHDAGKPEFERWSLTRKDGREPTADERREYLEIRSRRQPQSAAPRITEQFDLATVETLRTEAEQAVYRVRLRPGEASDHTAEHLQATVTVWRATRTIETIELANLTPFSPSFFIRIESMRTLLRYAPPTAERPSLPIEVRTSLRGRAFWFKSLDADLTVTYRDYAPARAKSP
jgi:hypothetical protein